MPRVHLLFVGFVVAVLAGCGAGGGVLSDSFPDAGPDGRPVEPRQTDALPEGASSPDSTSVCPGYATGIGSVAVARPPLQNVRERELACLSGRGSLEGRFVKSITSTGSPAAFSNKNDFRYGPQDPRFKEVQVYYYLTEMVRWIIPRLPDGSTSELLSPVAVALENLVVPSGSHWDGATIHLAVADYPDPTILSHELGHYLQSIFTTAFKPKGRSEAVAEGFCDLLAALFMKEPISGSWSIDPSLVPKCMRSVKSQRQYPFDVRSDKDLACDFVSCMKQLGLNLPQYALACQSNAPSSFAPASRSLGPILAAPIWDLGEKISMDVAARLALYLLTKDLRSVAQLRPALIQADHDLFGGSHITLIRTALDAHGLTESCGVIGDPQHQSGTLCGSGCVGTCLNGACAVAGSTAAELYALVGKLAVADPSARKAALKSALAQAGLAPQVQVFATGENLVVTLPGKAPAILISAHHDAKIIAQGNPGAIDNAAGMALAIMLAKTLNSSPVAHQVEIAFFDQEEAGALGATAFATNHATSDYLAVINLDMAGLGNAVSILRALDSNQPVRELVMQAAQQAGMPVVYAPTATATMGADDLVFLQKNVNNVISVGLAPAADVCSGLLYVDTKGETPPPLAVTLRHSPGDTPDKVQPAEMASLALVLTKAIRDLDSMSR